MPPLNKSNQTQHPPRILSNPWQQAFNQAAVRAQSSPKAVDAGEMVEFLRQGRERDYGPEPASPVEVAGLFSTVSVQRDYGPYLIFYEGGRFHKRVRGARRTSEPDPREIEIFQIDVLIAAQTDPGVLSFVESYPEVLQ
jgi:hypothetical protein